MDLFKPRAGSITRRPTDDTQKNGQVYNPPRFARLGGLKNARAIDGKNMMSVERATNKKVI